MADPVDLDHLEELHRATTPGPWQVKLEIRSDPAFGAHVVTPPESDGFYKGQFGYVTYGGYEGLDASVPHTPDAEFIAAAKNLLPALIAEVRQLRDGRELTRSLVDDMIHKLNDADSQLAHSEDRIDQLKAGLCRLDDKACPGVVAERLGALDGWVAHHVARCDYCYAANVLEEEGK